MLSETAAFDPLRKGAVSAFNVHTHTAPHSHVGRKSMPSGKKKGKGGGGETPRSEPTPSAAAEPVADAAADGEAEEEEEEEVQGNKRDGADISKVTDFVEQKELDSAKASKAIASIAADIEVDREAERERERELAAVVIEQVCMIRLSCTAHGRRPFHPT